MNYKKFYIEQLFDVCLAKGDLKSGDCEEGGYPLVSSGVDNYGIACYTNGKSLTHSKFNTELFDGGCITLDMFCNAFYRETPFFAVSHGRVNILIPKVDLNKYHCLYIVTLLNNEQFRFSYGRAVYSNIAKKIIIKLPITKDGNVDWCLIEDHMKTIEDHVKMHNCNKYVTKNKNRIELINMEKWKNFRLGDVFSNIEYGRVKDTSVLDFGEDICYIGAKKSNNGVMYKCRYDDKYISKGNCIMFICDGEGSIGYNNYMDSDFIGTINLALGYSEYLNQYVGLFLVTILDYERFKFSYGRKRKKILSDTVIKLPSAEDGSPDWKYMEDYIKSLAYGDCI